MTRYCDTHGKVTPDHYGASYRCPYCTGRAVWRDESTADEQVAAFEELERAQASAARTRINWMHRQAEQAGEET